jgi:hypothetical protein
LKNKHCFSILSMSNLLKIFAQFDSLYIFLDLLVKRLSSSLGLLIIDGSPLNLFGIEILKTLLPFLHLQRSMPLTPKCLIERCFYHLFHYSIYQILIIVLNLITSNNHLKIQLLLCKISLLFFVERLDV